MINVFKARYLTLFVFSILVLHTSFAQMMVTAGTGKVVCPGISFSVGGAPTATGGKAPYTYAWSPATYLSDPTIANPVCSPKADVYYTLTVTDDTGAVRTANVNITMMYIAYVNGGTDTTMCVGGSKMIGGPMNLTGKNVTYSWLPTTGLSDSSLPQPTASPVQTTTYSLTSIMSGCMPKVDLVTITVIPTPMINAGTDTTIVEGNVAWLRGSGGFNYEWSPTETLKYPNTANADAEPITTTVYTLRGKDATGQCKGSDSVTVTVTPSSKIVIYNTFTPNGDGNNDTWYIGNIEKFPDNKVEIFNRYGKSVFKTTGYVNGFDENTWDGKAFGNKLPSATYFYIIDLGVEGEDKYHGTVTIIE